MHTSSTALNVCILLLAVAVAVNDVFLRFQVLTKIHSRTSPSSTLCTLQNSVIPLGTDNQLSTLLTGVKYPVFAACASATWSISRISYTRGYITGDPKKVRNLFILFFPAKLITFAPISAGWSHVCIGFRQHGRWVWISMSTPTRSLTKYYLFSGLLATSTYIAAGWLWNGFAAKFLWRGFGWFIYTFYVSFWRPKQVMDYINYRFLFYGFLEKWSTF